MQHSFSHVQIKSIVGVYGSQIKDLQQVNLNIDAKKQSKMLKTLGFNKLRVAKEGVLFSNMLIEPAQKAIALAKVQASEIDAVMTISTTHDYLMPSTSFILQEKLGLSEHTMVLDGINSCSGFVNALFHISTLLEHGIFKNVLLCAGDIMHNHLVACAQSHPQGTQIANQMIFGDGASATVLSYSQEPIYSHYLAKSHGELYKSLVEFTPIHIFNKQDYSNQELYGMHIDGNNLSNYLFDQVIPSIKELLNSHHLSLENLSYAICHQGNRTLINSLALALESDTHKVPFLSKDTGNLFSASIPVLLSANHEELPELKTKPTMVAGFGVGLSLAIGIVDLTHTAIGDVLEF